MFSSVSVCPAFSAVFFELPEGEEDWALKIGAEVLITCSGDFTEPAPHYGTLISIRNADTDVPLKSITVFTIRYLPGSSFP